MDALGHPHLPFQIPGLARFVDEQADDGRAVLLGQREHPVRSRAGCVAIFEVGGVEHRPPADPLQPGLEHLGLGGVQRQGNRGLSAEAAGQLIHIGDAVPTDVVHAQIEQVGSFSNLLAGHLHTAVPVPLQHQVPELLGTVGVGALADNEERGLLGQGDVGINRSGRRLVDGLAGGGGEAATRLVQ